MSLYVIRLQDADKTMVNEVGGKGANLGELFSVEGIEVPGGFCVTTEAFKTIANETSSINKLVGEVSRLNLNEREKIIEVTSAIRRLIEDATIPGNITNEILLHLNDTGAEQAYAIRSSATAEDLPDASFAGQQDSYLNIVGQQAILKHIRKCWASLYTERAVVYRKRNGYNEKNIYVAVIVQQMVAAQSSGVLFTADPVTNNRKVISIDAAAGLGDALVAGVVPADLYKVEENEIIFKKTTQASSSLTNDDILRLAGIGRIIEKHFEHPQDIEWCFADNRFYIVQTRPITTLFPVPETGDQEQHVYISVSHQQMMTDAMKPLGLSIWKLTALREMYHAGGRLFVDVANELASPVKRDLIVNGLGKSDPLIRDALITILQRTSKDYVPDDTIQLPPSRYDALNDYDPSIVNKLIQESETLIDELKHQIAQKSGTGLIDFIFEDLQQLKQHLSDPRSFGVIMTGMNAASWLNEKMNKWLGEKNVADMLSQSVPNNITSEMGLDLLDVADVIREYPEVITYLENVTNDNFLSELSTLEGGDECKRAIEHYLDRYGMRCVGEIDITRTRWSEDTRALLPLIIANVKNFTAGESKRKFERGKNQAHEKEQELLERLKMLPDGEQKAAETKRMTDLVRHLAGYREYPKYSIVNRYFLYKKALWKEAEQLANAKIITHPQDIFFLSLEEIRDVIQTKKADGDIIQKRKDAFKHYQKLQPPRVMTSNGEIITGKYRQNSFPANAMIGLAVSSGIIEGRARVILHMEDADLQDGDILVTTFTDPSWTPLFVLIKGLVTEVGGLMTHGAVIAREYGIPAVVGVENATTLIRDGQRIRVHGTDGYVEIVGD